MPAGLAIKPFTPRLANSDWLQRAFAGDEAFLTTVRFELHGQDAMPCETIREFDHFAQAVRGCRTVIPTLKPRGISAAREDPDSSAAPVVSFGNIAFNPASLGAGAARRSSAS